MGNIKPIPFSRFLPQAPILINMAPITLYFLQTSRAIRTAFLLEALELDYTVEYFNREADGSTPEGFRKSVAVGRAPAIKDGDLVLVESSAIAE
jgi:glutathione S-transferase